VFSAEHKEALGSNGANEKADGRGNEQLLLLSRRGMTTFGNVATSDGNYHIC